jgi:hypothetical protein
MAAFNEFVPKEFDKVRFEPPAKPTKVKYEKGGVVVSTLTITYEGATENVETVEIKNVS